MEGLIKLVGHEQRCDQYHDQGKKEGYPDSIGPLYLIVRNRTEEQSRQASCTLVHHERHPSIAFSQAFANQPLDLVIVGQPMDDRQASLGSKGAGM